MWFTWPPYDYATANTRLRFYFDGESTPRIDLPLRDVFSGDISPFLYPLAAGDDVSSGGYYSYLPIPFAQSLKVSTSAFVGYYQIGYETYDSDVVVTSFSGGEDVSGAVARLLAAGSDPKPTAGNVIETGSTSLAVGARTTIYQRSGPGTVNSIKLTIPQTVPAPTHNAVTDNGRVLRGTSRFVVAIDPQATQVRLTRRLDYGVADQGASVFVDGAYAGPWLNAGSDATDRWRDATYTLPAALTAGKSQVQIQLADLLGGGDWTEYRYWVTSRVAGKDIVTDVVDVGDVVDEGAHGYQVSLLVSAPLLSASYPPLAGDAVAQQQSRELLTRVRLLAYWDGELIPSVDAPLGGLFGSWAGETPARSLLMGMNPDGSYYVYFPMPFATGARIEILNDSSVAISSLSYEIAYSPNAYPGLGTRAGYFRATTDQETPTQDGIDYTALDIDGQGHVVGMSLFTQSLPTSPFGLSAAHLEGDERIYVDGSGSPSLYGTGTEDFLNGGWYFREGVFSLPTHGVPVHFMPASGSLRLDETGAYRLFLTDAIGFRSGIKIGLEHGSPAGFESIVWNANYYSTVFWYGLPEPGAVVSDAIDVGDAASEQEHQYTAAGAEPVVFASYFYEGDADGTAVSDDGYAATGAVTFRVALHPNNEGVVLRRRADQAAGDQRALVSIDGAPAGTWHDPGRNSSKRWLDSEFVVPASATAGKSFIDVTLTPQGGVPWSAYRFWALSLVPVEPPPPKDDLDDTDGDTVPNGVDLDDDNDGCTDAAELTFDAAHGGQRDPHNPWDFYDVWTPAGSSWMRDRAVTITGDIFGVARRFGATRPGGPPTEEEALGEAMQPPASTSGYHETFDRGPVAGIYLSDSVPPDGAISISDILQVARQFGHSCV
jgi:hypothetical protein